jgi:CheY-like chemotaxis protein
MPKQSAKQRIILVDDHEVVRVGLKSLLERHSQFDVVGEASSAREAIEKTGTEGEIHFRMQSDTRYLEFTVVLDPTAGKDPPLLGQRAATL